MLYNNQKAEKTEPAAADRLGAVGSGVREAAVRQCKADGKYEGQPVR